MASSASSEALIAPIVTSPPRELGGARRYTSVACRSRPTSPGLSCGRWSARRSWPTRGCRRWSARTIHPFRDGQPGPVFYQRYAHPVGLEAERLIGELEGGPALLFPSGMGAITALALAVLAPGARIAVADGGYYGTFGMLSGELRRWGLEVVGFDQTTPPPPADLVWLEPCANPLDDLPRPRRRHRRRPRRRGQGGRRQHRAQPAAAAPARARRGLRHAQRLQDPGRPPRRPARRRHLRPRRGPRAPGDVPRRHRDRGRPRPGVAAAARAQDARGPRRSASRPRRSSWRAACRTTRRSRPSATRAWATPSPLAT